MTNQSLTNRQDSRADYRPLLSHSTILILSGFLIGLVSSRVIIGDLRETIMAVAIVGILAFVAFDHVRTRRKEHAEAREKLFVEGRLERHVDRCTATFEDLPGDSEDADLSLETIEST